VPDGTVGAYRAADVWKEFRIDNTSGLETAGAPADVRYAAGVLTVDTPTAEQITVYALSGAIVYRARKTSEGQAAFHLGRLPAGGVLIVAGDSGWVRKIAAHH
jgi:hypothetical protein